MGFVLYICIQNKNQESDVDREDNGKIADTYRIGEV
jgi:hypothetical protein